MKSLAVDNKRAREFMQEILPSEKTVAGKILSDCETWQFRAVVKESTTVERAHEFEAGGLCFMSESRDWLFGALQKNRYFDILKQLAVEDIWAERGDIFRSRDKRLGAMWIEESQFYCIDMANLERDLLEEFLSAPLSFFYAVVGLSSTIESLSADVMRKNAMFICMPAFDQESFLICGAPSFVSGEAWR